MVFFYVPCCGWCGKQGDCNIYQLLYNSINYPICHSLSSGGCSLGSLHFAAPPISWPMASSSLEFVWKVAFTSWSHSIIQRWWWWWWRWTNDHHRHAMAWYCMYIYISGSCMDNNPYGQCPIVMPKICTNKMHRGKKTEAGQDKSWCWSLLNSKLSWAYTSWAYMELSTCNRGTY